MRGAQPSTSRPPPAVAHATAEPQLPSDEMVELAVGDLDVHRRPPAAQRLRASTAVAVGEDGGHGASGARRAWPSSTAVIAYGSPTYCRLNAWTGSRSLKSWLLAAPRRSTVTRQLRNRRYLLTSAICSDQHRVWTVARARVVRVRLSRSGTLLVPDGSGKCTSKFSHHKVRTLYGRHGKNMWLGRVWTCLWRASMFSTFSVDDLMPVSLSIQCFGSRDRCAATRYVLNISRIRVCTAYRFFCLCMF